jgi:effector-binding domain-containing protein
MSYTVEMRQVTSQPIAVVKGRTAPGHVPNAIRQLYGKVYPVPPAAGKPGLNVVYYPHDSATCADFPIEAGVQVDAPFAGAGELVGSATPAGSVATTVFFGDYAGMSAAHEAIHEWAKENGRKLAGPSWEVYGHWDDRPEHRRTDIFYLLA